MFGLSMATWITVLLLTPFWWGMGLLMLAFLGDVSPWWRPRVSRLFDRLEEVRREPSASAAASEHVAA
jgi:hypothetical protein